MVEYYPCFEKDDEVIIGEDYLDLALLDQNALNLLLKEQGLKPIHDYVGFTPAQHEILNENMPPDMRRPWHTDDYNWSKPEVGQQIIQTVKNALETRPELFNDWPGMREDFEEVLSIGERVFARAVDRKARWHIISPGF